MFQTVMSFTFRFLFLSGVVALTFSSCDNPADDITDARVEDPAIVPIVSGGTTYSFTDNSSINFVGYKVTGKHDGGFKDFEGSFTLKDGEPQAGNFTIDMSSTWSDAEKLTTKLKSDEFFDVEQFPKSEFVVTEFAKKSDESYDVSGNLTLHGVTKNITFPTVVKISDGLVKVDAQFDIKRFDFEIVYPGKTDDLIRDEVSIKFSLEAKSN